MKQFIDDVKRYYKYAIYSGKAELKSGVAESHLSWLWWVLDPLLFMLVYSFVSLFVFGRGEQYFSAFIFIGYTSFKFFEKTLKNSVSLVKSNKPIICKVYIPKHILLLSKLYVNGFEAMIAFALVICTMFIYRVPLTLNIIFFIPLVFLLVLLTFGLSTIMMHFGVYVEDLSNVIDVFLRLLFYISGVFYSFNSRFTEGEEYLKILLLKCNPMAFIIDQMRNALLYGLPMDWITYFIWVVISILCGFIGIHLICKNENSYVKVI